MGKTSLATNIAFNIARAYKKGTRPDGSEGAVEGGVVGFFSLEMSSEQLAARILSEASRVPSHQIRHGDMTEEEMRRFIEAAQDARELPALHRRHPGAADLHHRRPRPPPEAPARPRRPLHRLPPARPPRLLPLRGPRAGGLRDHPGPEGDRQGAQHPGRRPLPALPPGREPRGQAPAALRPARVGLDRAGRRRRDVRLPRGVLQGAREARRPRHRGR